MYRRSTLALLFAMALVLAACGEPPGTGDPEAFGVDEMPECPLDALDDAVGPVTVPLWYGGLVGAAGEAMDEMVARFNASQDDVVVDATDQGAAYQEVLRAYESTAAASPGGLPGIVYLEDTTLAQMVDRGHVLPGQSCIEAAGYDLDQIEPVARAYYTVGDILWPGYMNTSTPVLYYNKAHWLKAGLDPDDPPATLEELREQAEVLKESGVSEKPFAIELTYWYFTSWLNPVGVEMVNHDDGRAEPATEGTFDVERSRELLEFLDGMNDDGLLNPFAFTEGSIDHYLAVATEQSSMLLGTSTASTTIRDFLGGDLTAAEAGVDFDESVLDLTDIVPGAALYPGMDEPGQAQVGGGAFYILNTTPPEVQAGSWRFLEFMLQPENAKLWLFEGGYVPIVSAVIDEPDVQEYFADDLAGLMLDLAYQQIAAIDPDDPGPLIGPFETFNAEVGRAMEDVLLADGDVSDAMASAREGVTRALERYQGL